MANIRFRFWEFFARIILKNRLFILLILSGITLFLAFQWKNLRMTYTEANMLPNHHPINIDYQKFLKTFGEEGNLIVIGANIDSLFQTENFSKWNALSAEIQKFPQVEGVISTHTIKELVKDTISQSFQLKSFFQKEDKVTNIRQKLLQKTPFYQGILYNSEKNTLRMVVSMKKEIVNTSERKHFILKKLQPILQKYEHQMGMKLHTSGMPYLRTLNAEIITGEIGLFIIGALTITCLIFFFFFRSFRAMFISMSVVILGVMWAFGFLGLLGYEITILTAVIPPLIIVIGLPNCIFLINKYQQEINKHQFKAMALHRVISKVGNVTLISNLTTAAGFATFTITESTILQEFGLIASINILCLFVISLCVIPIAYSYMDMPKATHLKHLNKKWINYVISVLLHWVKRHRHVSYIIAFLLLGLSIMGISKMKVSGSLIEDMPHSAPFFKDILYFEEKFGGVLPLEITIDTHKKKGVMRASSLEKINEFELFLDSIPEISKPLSVISLVKYAKQAFYNGNPAYYDLPSPQERIFMLSYLKKAQNNAHLLKNMVDANAQKARITVFMKDLGTDKMTLIENKILQKSKEIFPSENFTIKLTGKAYIFTKGTNYLVNNLIQSLGLTILIIALLMAYLFRSFRIVMASLLPNFLPLLITAGTMGFLGIPLKPSTILVFGIAFGISVDDSIHFLAKFRQELKHHKGKIKRSVYAALRETSISMFYTSVVLFFGFSVFALSDFGGTKALGWLISITLLFAMLSNLVLLPSLLLTFTKNKQSKLQKK